MPQPRLSDWLSSRSGLAHRSQILDAGFTEYRIRLAVAAGDVKRLPRGWLARHDVERDLERAAARGGRLTCLSAAHRHGLWVPDHPGRELLHLRVPSSSGRHARSDAVLHWSAPPVPAPRHGLVDPVVNVLEAVARCVPFEQALTVWESAVKRGDVTIEFLRRVDWRASGAKRLAAALSGLSDSGLETIFVNRLRPYGLRIRQQVWIDGHPVDVLVGDRLVVQLDGFEHHGDARQRRSDIRGDARLVLLGYTVLRFDYQQVLHDWSHVEASVMGAVAQGLHRAA